MEFKNGMNEGLTSIKFEERMTDEGKRVFITQAERF
jgi:hypothetical protein